MSDPRPVIPNQTLFITRRTYRRQFLLKPSPKLNKVFLFLLGYLTKKYGIELNAVTIMSNHIHYVMADPCGAYVPFTRELHALSTRALNCMRGDFEGIWSKEQTSKVVCAEGEDIAAKMAYTMANPVAAALVRKGKQWPGIRMAWPQRTLNVCRPDWFFSQSGELPTKVQVEFHRPRGFDNLSDGQLEAHLARLIRDAEIEAVKQVEASGHKFLGRKKVTLQRRFAYPGRGERRFGLRPHLACKSKWSRIERLQKRKLWLRAYHRAFAAWRRREPAVFPFGTWKMRVVVGVPCHPT